MEETYAVSRPVTAALGGAPMLYRLSPRWLIPFTLVVLLLAACGDSADYAADTTLAATTTSAETTTTTSAETTTTTAATTTTASATTTTTQPTTTTTAATTTTVACPGYPSVSASGYGDELEPGSYNVPWTLPKYSFTVNDPTKVFLGDRYDEMGWRPSPDPAWQHPTRLYELLLSSFYTHLASYDGENEIEVPEDPTTWLTEHPMMETTEPVPVTVDGHDAMQVDAIVLESHPNCGDNMRFAGSRMNTPGSERWLPVGAAIRFVYVEVDDYLLWFILTATEDGFDDAAAWADTIIAGIEFC